MSAETEALILARIDAAVGIGTIGLALVVALLAVIAVRSLWSS